MQIYFLVLINAKVDANDDITGYYKMLEGKKTTTFLLSIVVVYMVIIQELLCKVIIFQSKLIGSKDVFCSWATARIIMVKILFYFQIQIVLGVVYTTYAHLKAKGGDPMDTFVDMFAIIGIMHLDNLAGDFFMTHYVTAEYDGKKVSTKDDFSEVEYDEDSVRKSHYWTSTLLAIALVGPAAEWGEDFEPLKDAYKVLNIDYTKYLIIGWSVLMPITYMLTDFVYEALKA